jgi:hypothetical protein
MGSNDNQTLKRLTPFIFIAATLFLVLGIFLSMTMSANAQTVVPGTMMPGGTETMMASTMMAGATAMTSMPGGTETAVATSVVGAPVATGTPGATETTVAMTSVPVTGGTSVPATVGAPAAGLGTPTALVPVTGIDLAQVQSAAAAQQHVVLDVGIVVVGLGLLILGLLFRSGRG